MNEDKDLAQRLEEMDKADLVTYANMTYGLNVNARVAKAELIANILRANQRYRGNADIDLDETSSMLRPGYSRIRINKTELNKKGRPIIVGLNGKMYSLPVGVEFNCPQALVEILNNAVQVQYESDPSTNGLVAREMHSYPFVVLETAAPRK